MPWDKVGGRVYHSGGNSGGNVIPAMALPPTPEMAARRPEGIQQFGAWVFELTSGKIVRTTPSGTVPNMEDHVEWSPAGEHAGKAVKLAIVVRWQPGNFDEQAAGRLYFDEAVDAEQRQALLRMFQAFALVDDPPKDGGNVSIEIAGDTGTGAEITIGAVGRLLFKPHDTEPVTVMNAAPGYREEVVPTNGSQSRWADELGKWSGTGFATAGEFTWFLPASRYFDTGASREAETGEHFENRGSGGELY